MSEPLGTSDSDPAQPAGQSTLIDFARHQADGAKVLPQSAHQSTETDAETHCKGIPKDLIPGYALVRELGRGGQGVVFEAIQQSTRRKVAVKLLHEWFLHSDHARRRFEREIDLIVRLKHPGIISVFDSGKTPAGQPYFVMEYVQGVSLHKFVREERLTLEAILTLFVEVCDAVQFAHQQGIMHRDLKPSNILVDHLSKPRVMDFGLAKSLVQEREVSMTLTQSMFGTLPYMSPEQTRGKLGEIDTRTDVYALGVILYELLTGHYPYPVVNNLADILAQFAELEPTPPTRRWARDKGVTRTSARRLRGNECPIDDEVQLIVMHALNKDRTRRFQTAHEMAAEIRRYLAGQPIGIKGDSIWYVVRKKAFRHKTLTAAVVLMLISNFGWGAFGLSSFFSARSAQREKAEAWQRSRLQVAEFNEVADRAAQNRREIAARSILGWFHSEWQAGRIQFAKQIQSMLAKNTPESAIAEFLIDSTVTEERFLAGFSDDWADWAWFAVGERRLREGHTRKAGSAFQRTRELARSELLSALARQRMASIQNMNAPQSGELTSTQPTREAP